MKINLDFGWFYFQLQLWIRGFHTYMECNTVVFFFGFFEGLVVKIKPTQIKILLKQKLPE